MVSRYHIRVKGRLAALAYVTPHPVSEKHVIASVFPIEHAGKWEDNNLEYHLRDSVTDLFPKNVTDGEVIRELLMRVGIRQGYSIEKQDSS
jgi:hypothetical protein